MTDRQKFFGIWNGFGWLDGEMYADSNRKELYRSLCFADPGDRVFEFFPDEPQSTRDITEDAVREAYEAGYIDRDCAIAREFINFPITAEEHAGNIADDRWHDTA